MNHALADKPPEIEFREEGLWFYRFVSKVGRRATREFNHLKLEATQTSNAYTKYISKFSWKTNSHCSFMSANIFQPRNINYVYSIN